MEKCALRSLHTESEIFVCVFSYSSSFPIKMLVMDAKTQKIEPDPNFFYDGRKFWRQYVNVIETTWGRIYFLTCENFGHSVQWHLILIFAKFKKKHSDTYNSLYFPTKMTTSGSKKKVFLFNIMDHGVTSQHFYHRAWLYTVRFDIYIIGTVLHCPVKHKLW